jgi:SnoaL-like domain
MMTHSIRDEVVEVVNKLFIYTDTQDWEKLQGEVFSNDVFFDMSSLGGKKEELTSKAICEMWQNGFKDIDSINHLAGNYLVKINDTIATVFAYATAVHFREAAKNGTTREFIGTYNINLMKHGIGWRIYQFKYDLKFISGNIDLT